ncbi:MAG TPA: glycogen/starch synthase [Myxococcota bacterium]|nr:glycogen/starch synthase [Myxococcota bacterium]
MRLFFATSELTPLAQSGGLGDAVAGLAAALAARGHEVVSLLPAYRSTLANPACPRLREAGALRLSGPFGEVRGRWLAGTLAPRHELLLLDVPPFFDRPGLYGEAAGPYGDEAARFASFSRAVAARAYEARPDVLVAHDWPAALSVAVLRTLFDRGAARGVGTVQVLHNNAYQGRQSASAMAWTGLPGELFAPDGLEFFGDLSLLKGGLVWADRIVAVSPNYAREVQTPDFGLGLEGLYQLRRGRLCGIANGLDVDRFDPATDKALPERFYAGAPAGKRTCRARVLAELGLRTPEPGRFLVGIGRLTAQKGWDVLAEAIPALVADGATLALLGDGDRAIASSLVAAARRFPDRVHATISWDERGARRLYGAADALLVPSRFEPCGLVQLTAQRYGALPIAHRTGGLADTIRDGETGVLFAPLTAESLVAAATRAAKLVEERGQERIVRELLRLDVGWARPAALWEAVLEDVAREARARI